jgi:hypothetical protein
MLERCVVRSNDEQTKFTVQCLENVELEGGKWEWLGLIRHNVMGLVNGGIEALCSTDCGARTHVGTVVLLVG